MKFSASFVDSYVVLGLQAELEGATVLLPLADLLGLEVYHPCEQNPRTGPCWAVPEGEEEDDQWVDFKGPTWDHGYVREVYTRDDGSLCARFTETADGAGNGLCYTLWNLWTPLTPELMRLLRRKKERTS